MINNTDINQEIIDKIEELESDTYVYPKRFGAVDYVLVVIVTFICLIGIILGAYIK